MTTTISLFFPAFCLAQNGSRVFITQSSDVHSSQFHDGLLCSCTGATCCVVTLHKLQAGCEFTLHVKLHVTRVT